ncbi:MAG: pyruvate ferredoxin oxidoreductase [Firmicutes bacterium]|nr:pyruvate ferredoxin oxidoreductase [Bacillota bacterium]
MERKLMNGNQAAALAIKCSRVQVVCAYPITPQTSLVENIADMWAKGIFPGEYVSVESEYSALSYLIGASYAGARTFTATSSQGLAYMHELLHWAAGARLPIVLVNVNRAMGAPWSLEPDQLDSLAQRDTGWIQFYCADVQEIMDTLIMAFRLAEQTRIPCMVVYDGFVLSHTYEVVEPPLQEQVDAFLPPPPYRAAISPANPQTIQAVTDSRYLSRVFQERHLSTLKVPELARKIGAHFREIFGRHYPLAEAVNLEEADTVIVTAGAPAQTVKSFLRSSAGKNGQEKLGLLRLRLFRPLPAEEIVTPLCREGIKRIVVIDRNISAGTGGIFAQELRAVLQGTAYRGEIAELNLAGGVDLTPELLHRALQAVSSRSAGDRDWSNIIWGVDLQ